MKLKTATLLIALSLPLAGCGNKGPLVLPQAPEPVDELPVMPEDELPVPPDAPATDAVDPAAPTGDTAEPAADATSPTTGGTPPDPAPQDGDG